MQNNGAMAIKIDKWIEAQRRHRLSDLHVQMARELALNPDKLGKIDNHDQELWKAPLPQFIEHIYYKRFKRDKPLGEIKSVQRISKEQKTAKEKKKKLKIKNMKTHQVIVVFDDQKVYEAILSALEESHYSTPIGDILAACESKECLQGRSFRLMSDNNKVPLSELFGITLDEFDAKHQSV